MQKKLVSLILVLSLLFALAAGFAGCAKSGGDSAKIAAIDLMDGIVPKALSGSPAAVSDAAFDAARTVAIDFAVRLFQETYDGKNTLVSPISVLAALAMTANGAKGETLSQMESAFGASVDELNEFFAAYLASLSQTDSCKLSIADSIWLRDDERLAVKTAFLQKNADCYRAAAYRAPFDSRTLDDINRWVKTNTDGMIEKILNEIPNDAMLYLVNALAFDAKWLAPYTMSEQVTQGDFRKEDGSAVEVTYLEGDEYRYLVDGGFAKGFVKPYVGGRYAFAALRPNDGISVGDYVASLDGAKIAALLDDVRSFKVEVKLPKFEVSYDANLNLPLIRMGMTDAFGFAADFSGISESVPLYIGNVLHKTFLSLGEEGTRAAAATVVEMKALAIAPEEAPPRIVLDRPFVYLLIDTKANVPLFIGVLNDPKN